MCKIEFKAWDKKKKVYTNWKCYDNMFYFMDKFTGVWIRDDDFERFTLIQYTGLKDRTGTRIYEGDILELINEVGERVKCVVEFGSRKLRTSQGVIIDIQGFYFKIGDRKTNPVVVNYKGMHDLDIMEIRGNIYEDHELIGGVSNE